MIKPASHAPVCAKRPHTHQNLNDQREDPYYWLNNREDPEVIKYLEEENAYTADVMADSEQFRSDLFEEMKARIKEDDASVPYFLNGYWYYTRFEKGGEYPIYCRKKDTLESEEIILLNVNELAKGFAYYEIGGLSVSPNNKVLAYGVDTVSRRIYTVHFKNLETGESMVTTIENTTGGTVWMNDNDTLFYSSKDSLTLRSDRIHRFRLSDGVSREVYYEEDATFYTGVTKTKSKKYILIVSSSTLTREYRILNADQPDADFIVFQPRIRGLEYGVEHAHNSWYILTNHEAKNFRLMRCPESNTGMDQWEELIPHRDDVLLEGIELFNNFMVLEERRMGLTHLVIKELSTQKVHEVEVADNCYTLGTGNNPEFNTEVLRYGYSSLITPTSTYDYNMVSRDKTLMKQQEVLGGYDAGQYRSERIFVEARDGVKVPLSLVYRKDYKLDGRQPLLLYGYGSYGHSIDPTFSSVRLSLLNRGFAFAIAHIRGGEELGRNWYDTGKLLEKKNTFFDFIDCGKYLVANKYTSPEHLYAMGGSAGGLLMGAVMNMEPQLFNGLVAAVPFVDVVTTMLDESIPLTTGEFDEWGNPKDETFYHYIKSYSPYDNVERKDYPHLLVTTGLHDSQVQYWEPAKWVAKLRDMKTDQHYLLLKTEMDFGHGGASGRFEQLREISLEYTFLFNLENINQ